MFVAVGSGSNIDDPDSHPGEKNRADILEYTPDGKFVKIYASGIRNPVGLAVNPTTGEVWCSVNERDELGDNLVPDYVTSVKEGGFYGWPYYLHGRESRSAPQGQPSGAAEQSDRAGCADPAAQRFAGAYVLYGTQFPAGVSRRCVRGRARILESCELLGRRSHPDSARKRAKPAASTKTFSPGS